MFLTLLASTSLLSELGPIAEIVLVCGGIVGVIIIAVNYLRSKGRDNALNIANQNVDAYEDMVAVLNQKYEVLQGKYEELQQANDDSLEQIKLLTTKVKDLSDLISGTKAIDTLSEKLDSHHEELKQLIENLEAK